MSASSRTRLAVAAAAVSVTLVGCMTGTAIAFEDPDWSSLYRPAAAPSTPTAKPSSGSSHVIPQTTPRTAEGG